MIKDINEKEKGPIEIDLTGSEGNAFVIIGYAKNFAKQLRWNKEDIDKMIREMMSSDYENLINIFDKNFGEFVILYR